MASPAVSDLPPEKARTFPTKQTTLDKSCSSGREWTPPPEWTGRPVRTPAGPSRSNPRPRGSTRPESAIPFADQAQKMHLPAARRLAHQPSHAATW